MDPDPLCPMSLYKGEMRAHGQTHIQREGDVKAHREKTAIPE